MKRVFLVGYMGVGKTTIGKLLSDALNLEFIDLDKYIENRYRKSVKILFDEKGEDGFRSIEHEMLLEVATFQNVLVATGGGTPCFYDNMATMNEHGVTVYVKASIDHLVLRLLASKNVRPLIENKTPDELKVFIAEHLKQREKYYSKALVVYESTHLVSLAHVNESVEDLKTLLKPYF
ncbi:MAG: shikimate kinase [Candidatus Saccharimonadaceae bacterium]